MTSPETGRPLAETDLDRLGRFLVERVLPNEGMSLEILDGFLSAIVVSPLPVSAREYLPQVWGERAPEWTSPADQDEAAALVEDLRLHILWRVQHDPEELGDAAWPFVILPPDVEDGEDEDPEWADFPTGAGWAAGFLHGMSLRDAAWSQRMEEDEDVADDVAMLFALSRVGGDDDDETDEAGDDAQHAISVDESTDEDDDDAAHALDAEQRLDLVAVLPDMLHDLHCLRIHELRPAPARRAAEPGRNDACPCGSGRKYKKCCGAAV